MSDGGRTAGRGPGRPPHERDARPAEARPPTPLEHVRRLAVVSGELAHLERHDQLTGLGNRIQLLAEAGRALARAACGERATALLLVDLDRFSDVNDALGHVGGDAVLVEVARRIAALLTAPGATAGSAGTASTAGIVARLAGDEFVVLCERVDDLQAAAAVARRIIGALAPPVQVAGGNVGVTASIGIALAPPGRTDVDGLLLEAGAAMRHAKQRGRGLSDVYADGMRVSSARDAVQALKVAIDERQLRLHYQPKVALDSDRIVGVEALLRWEHPDRGLVSPHEFIQLAEETGLIVPIGTWVLQEACRERARWEEALPRLPPLVVSVNVSPRQFGAALVETVTDALAGSGIPPSSLCLEVTESIVMDDVEGAIVTLRELAGLGVLLSVDDFGTGYSSFSYLKRLALDELKIDKSFVDGLGRDANDTAIVAAVVAMAHALDLRVVAEGVETADQLVRLRALGCEEAQGYLLARPGPPAAITTLLLAEAGSGFRSHAGQRAPADGVAPPGRTPTVLVVDDSDDVRFVSRISLSAVGFDVHEAADGAAAVSMARALVPDGIVLDLVLPDVDGAEVCRILRADRVTAGITIVMATGNADADDKVRAFSAGADDYIVKPFSPRELTSRMNAALRRRDGGADHGPPAGPHP
jgi:diguanylate cyclase (GGDEF)-like protein